METRNTVVFKGKNHLNYSKLLPNSSKFLHPAPYPHMQIPPASAGFMTGLLGWKKHSRPSFHLTSGLAAAQQDIQPHLTPQIPAP